MATREITYQQAVQEALRSEMRADPTVILLGEDIAGGATSVDEDAWGGPLGTTRGFIKEFGKERVRDCPISEAGFVGAAVGAATTGLRPVVELMYNDFLGTCLDQILNQAAKLRYMFGGKAKVPMVLRTTIGAGLRKASQHSQVLYSIFAHIPGLKLIAPSTPYDMKGLLISAIRDDDPVVDFEHKLMYWDKGPVPEESYTIPLGKADIKRPGKDVTIVGISRMVKFSLEAAEKLVSEGIEAEVVDPRTLWPLDESTLLESVKKTGKVVIVDESTPNCSMGRNIAAIIAEKAFDYLDAPVKCLNAPPTPVPFSPSLEDFYLPNPDKIFKTVLSQFRD